MRKYKLRELLTIKNGCDYRHLSTGSVPVYGSGGFMCFVNQAVSNKPSILLPRKGTLNNIMFIDKPFWTVDTMYWSEIKEDIVEPYYLYNYLKVLKFDGIRTGSTLPSMTSSAYYDIPVILPDYNKQTRVANILKLLNNKIELNNKINQELEQMAKIIYDYWFVQFDFPDEKGRPYKSANGKMVYNEVLKREIPDGWEVKPLKYLIKHINTGLNPRDNFILGNGNIKYITVKNITENNLLDFKNCDTIDEIARNKVHNRSDIQVGDILFASITPLGRCYLIQESPIGWDINESVFSIRPNLIEISSEYLLMCLTSKYFTKKASNSSTGSIFSGIRIKTLENMSILIPPQNILKTFTKKLNQLLKRKNICFKENIDLEKVRDFLLPLLMNGQITVNPEC